MDACVYYIYNNKTHIIGTSCIKQLYEGLAPNGGALFYACAYIYKSIKYIEKESIV